MNQLGVDIAFGSNTGTWQHAGQYSVWTGSVQAGAPVPQVLEMRGDEIAAVAVRETMLHVIPAGRPHRLSHLFGFWRVSDGDTFVLLARDPAVTRFAFVAATSAPSYAKERLRFACPNCRRVLKALAFDARRLGFERYWDEALAEARAFSADAAGRRCSHCATLHPIAYGLNAQSDTPDERAARLAW